MPVCKQDETLRALALLEDYHAKLSTVPDNDLQVVMKIVISVFKSRLFQALVDIQEFYELALQDESHSVTDEDISIAQKYIMDQFDAKVGLNDLNFQPLETECQRDYKKKEFVDISCQINGLSGHTGNQSCGDATEQESNLETDDETEYWEYDKITVERGSGGLGFSIAGGVDSESLVLVTRVSPDIGATGLRANDIILKVNDQSLEHVPHSFAVAALKNAGDIVTLHVKRRKKDAFVEPEKSYTVTEIELEKEDGGFGFTIAGGVGNVHLPGDSGVYVTKILEGGAAHKDSRIEVGDKLIAVKNTLNGDVDLENVTHEEAVAALKETGDKVTLVIVKESLSMRYIKPKIPIKSSISSKSSSENISLMLEKVATIRRSDEGLGFNIVGGEDKEGIFISYVAPGSPADQNGILEPGDRILSVNAIDMLNATHDDAAIALKGDGPIVTIVAQQRPEEYHRLQIKLADIKEQIMKKAIVSSSTLPRPSQKLQLFVRALFDYDPNRDDGLPSRGISFTYGSILHILNANDDEWWQAKKLVPAGEEDRIGIVPSKKRWERKQKSRDRTVKFQGHVPVLIDKTSTLEKKKKNFALSRMFPFMRSKADRLECTGTDQDHYMLCYTHEDPTSEGINLSSISIIELLVEEPTLPYESVVKKTLNYSRPVIVVGIYKDKINDHLISEYPEEFGSCVPHTSREIRHGEVDGVHYHFIKSREQMERDIKEHLFIEAGQFNDNLYGTSLASVQEVAEQNKHCILDVSSNAIKRLQAADLYPITIFIKASSLDFIMKISDKMTEDRAKKIYDQEMKVEQDYNEYLTAIIKGDSFEDIFEKVKNVIDEHSGPDVWLPNKDLTI
ncbi:disks large homolog 1-like isoform X1 [Rhopalosiphum maidis]|uniref:disks large homolog 1-like isoform X1 n=1 Tax=Rhopalosiphum maidis TaxID=43146 RepID=UPI000EFDD835|nr:disks large homolog 1-like isoform X1 [Rhopalosiphum maidis]